MISDDYRCRQSARDSEYEAAYQEWVQSLRPDERERLQEVGLDSPAVHRRGSGSASGDATESPLMSEGHDPVLQAEPEPNHTSENPRACEIMRRLLGELLAHDNARLTIECLSLVSGLSYTGCSMTDIGRRHGISRAAVSKRCVELADLLGLRPSRSMRSSTARSHYRDARIRSIQQNEHTYNSPDQ